MYFRQSLFCSLGVSLALMQGAIASDVSLGVGVGTRSGPYKDMDNKVLALPFVDYESTSFFLHGVGGGVHLWKDDHQEINVLARYAPWNFDPDDSDDWRLQQLDKRRATVMAGLSYVYRERWGEIHAELLGDVLDNSDGMTGDLSYQYTFLWQGVKIIPGVGGLWSSKNQNKYYYGVSQNESVRSGLRAYTPDDSFSPYVQLAIDYPFAGNWAVSVSARYMRLADTVKDSPMVDTSGISTVGLGVRYNF